MSRVEFKASISLDGIRDRMTRGAQDGVRKAAEFLLTEANKSVPHDEGTLERSGTSGALPVESATHRRGFVSYDTPYAVRQHEDMSLHHDGKGQSKWLENTLTEHRADVAAIVAQSMNLEGS